MKFSKIYLFLSITFISAMLLSFKNHEIKPGQTWLDISGNAINAHGGGMLYFNDMYYWYGEIKSGQTTKVEYIKTWECYRTNAGGVSCYSSKNLVDWKYEGIALSPNNTDSTNDLHTSKVIERPKVIYNNKTKKFVMWLHVDSEDYSFARAAIAISDKPAGPFKYLYSMRPNNQMSRDMNLFKDTDGKAYHIFSSEDNKVMHISLLTDDYLQPSGIETRIFINKSREAPAMFKHNGKYYLITSGCTGWSSNEAMLASADSILGQWTMLYNPCKGHKSEITFDSQSTFVFPVEGKQNAYIFMADRWNKTDLKNSIYIWLPIKIENNKLEINWLDTWNMDNFK